MSNVRKLPDSYAKHASSNNYKLLKLNELAIVDAKEDAEALFDVIDLQKATGRTLDLYGNMVGQKRGTLNDTQYRALILTRIGINLAHGNYATVIESVKNIFGCEGKDVVMKDGEGDCEVVIESFPLKVLVNTEFTSTQAIEVIESLLPICTKITTKDIEFQGTFEFAATGDEYDPEAGFGDVAQTNGGYLGMLIGEDESSTILPL